LGLASGSPAVGEGGRCRHVDDVRMNLLATGSFDGTVAVYDLSDENEENGRVKFDVLTVLEGPGSEIKSVKFSRESLTLVVGSRDKSIWIWGIVGDLDESKWECLGVLDGSKGDVKGKFA